MVNGHNKGSDDPDPENKTKGQNRSLKESAKDKNPKKGRNKNEDPSQGKKGKNNI
jgi:hypothetical protein